MTENNDKEVFQRITALEVKVQEVLTNHLPHIQGAIDKVNAKLFWVFTLLVVNLLAIIINLLKDRT